MKLRRQRKDEDLAAEIRHHLDEAIRDRIARGEAPEEARANAVREFGNVGLVKEVTREMWGWGWLERLTQDLRFGLRMLRKNPSSTLIAILTLALGIGANTAIFSVVNAVLLKPLPYAQAERLVRIWETNVEKGGAREMTSLSNLRDWQRENRTFQDIAAWQRPNSITFTGQTPALELKASFVSANFFALLGTPAALGRTFSKEEGNPGSARVVVVSYGWWQRQLGANPNLVGQEIQLEKTAFQVIGVMPREFKSPAGEADLWLPVRHEPNDIDRGQTYLQAVARLNPNVTLAEAQADADALAATLASRFPASNRGRGLALVPLLEQTVGEVRDALRIVFGAVLFVLLIACANVANLLLVRVAGRARELAVRAALGATRWRIARQLLSEILLVFAAGGMLGLLAANWTIALLQRLSPDNLPRLDEVGVDLATLLFAFAITLLAGIVFGLAPAWQGSAHDLNVSRKTSNTDGKQRLRAGFVIAQIAFALVLLVGAGLLLRSFAQLSNVPPGFDAHNLLVVRIFLDGDYHKEQRHVAYFRELTQRLQALPGVATAGAATVLPLNPFGIDFDVPWHRAGEPEPPRANAAKARFRSATPEYFQTLGIPLRAGRAFDERDAANGPRVVIVNQALAERSWPNENPLGKRLRFFWADWQTYEVVGVAGNTKSYGLASDWRSELFVPHAQIPYTAMNVAVRTTVPPESLVAEVRRVILSLDATQPPHSIVTMEELLAASLARERFALTLLEIFAGLALLLAAVGIYGVLSYAATQRTHEIGIRMALGAEPRDVLKLVVRHGMLLTLPGIAAGLAAAFALTRLMTTLLFGVSATDPLTFAAIALLLLSVALFACWIPARRATKVDPLIALRHE
ncbi:MAG: ABC transporter permease [Blastocatellia bacterium]|nr:ABC transporter permease [Blastocatellia bacterium]